MPGAVYSSWSEVAGPTVLRAESIAAAALPALASPGHGRIHSLFPQVAHLAMDGADLISLLVRPAGRLPNGVHVDEDVDLLDPRLGLAVGAPVRVDDAVLRLSEELRVDLRWAPPWSFEIEPVQPIDRARLAANSRRLRRRVKNETALLASARRLVSSARAVVPDGIEGAVADLAAGDDDVLLGLAAVLRAAEHPAAPLVGRAIELAADRAPDVGGALLRLAARGQHAELIGRLAVSLLVGDEDDVEASLDALPADGTSSARAGLSAGALLGLAILV